MVARQLSARRIAIHIPKTHELSVALAGITPRVRGGTTMAKKIIRTTRKLKDVLADSFTVGTLTDQLAGTQHLLAVQAVDAGMREDHEKFDELAPGVRQLGYAIALLDKYPRTARVSVLLEEAAR